MPHLDHTGPEGKGPDTGRGLGKCRKDKDVELDKLGKGQGKRRHSGGGEGEGKRLKSSRLFEGKDVEGHEDCQSPKE